jgi:hypothetical protein
LRYTHLVRRVRWMGRREVPVSSPCEDGDRRANPVYPATPNMALERARQRLAFFAQPLSSVV